MGLGCNTRATTLSRKYSHSNIDSFVEKVALRKMPGDVPFYDRIF